MKREKGKREVERETDRRKETRLLGSSANKKCTILMFPLIFFSFLSIFRFIRVSKIVTRGHIYFSPSFF